MFALHHSGMHVWILDEMALGKRVAHYLDSENNTQWTALHDLSYEQYCKRERETNGAHGRS